MASATKTTPQTGDFIGFTQEEINTGNTASCLLDHSTKDDNKRSCCPLVMNKPGECPVCYDDYDESLHQPRSLPCGHTFCSRCITCTVEDDNLTCPSCRAHHSVAPATSFPINFSVQDFVRNLKSTRVTERPRKKFRGMEEEKKCRISSLVSGCGRVLSQLREYRGQLGEWKTQHHQLEDRLVELNTAVCELLEQEATSVMNYTTQGEEGRKQLEAILLCSNTNTVNTDNVDKTSDMVKDWLHKCQQLFPDYNTVHTSMRVQMAIRDALKKLTTETGAADVTVHLEGSASSIGEKVGTITGRFYFDQLTVEDLRRMSEPVKRLVEAGRVFAVQEDQDGSRSARITSKDGQLCLHSLLHQPTPAHTLQESEVVGMLNPSCTLAFLDLGWAGSTRGRVTIRLTPDTLLARQFVLLCTGQRGQTYHNTKLFWVACKGRPGECVVGGESLSNNGRGGVSLLPDLESPYRSSGRAGAVWASLPGRGPGSHFVVITRDRQDGGQYPRVFGDVVRGLDVMRAAVNHSDITQVTVVDCGIVLPL